VDECAAMWDEVEELSQVGSGYSTSVDCLFSFSVTPLPAQGEGLAEIARQRHASSCVLNPRSSS